MKKREGTLRDTRRGTEHPISALALREAFRRSESFLKLRAPETGRPLALGELFGSSKSLLVAALSQVEESSLVVLCCDEIDVEDWSEDLALFASPGAPAPLVLPELAMDDDGREPLPESLLTRRSLLESLGSRTVLLCNLAALMAPVAPPGATPGKRIELRTAQTLAPGELLALAEEAGMTRVPQVLMAGEVSLRGDVLDLFPPGGSPLRIEFFDDEIDSLREFSPAEQRSTGSLDSASILLPVARSTELPSAELPFPLDALDPSGAWIVVVEPVRFEEQFSRFTLREGSESRPVAAFRESLPKFRALTLSTLPVTAGRNMGCGAPRQGPLERGDLKGRILAAGEMLQRPLVVLRSRPEADRLLRLARETLGPDPGIDAVVGSLTRGFRLPELGRVLLNHGEFFGTGVARRRRVGRQKRHEIASEAIESFFELEEGDLVVHAVHGIARYGGLERASRGVGSGSEDHLRLAFQGGIEVLVPASKIDLVQKYVGSGQIRPKLDKVGGRSFARRRSQVAHALRDMAAELLEVQVARSRAKGFAVPAEDPLAREFEQSFPYSDTPDQAKSTQEIEADLEATKPMDRLLCGDVGFGKTELAMRAALRVVSAGRQVAVLVPTTLLADQHGRTFRDRMASFAVNVDVLSRLQSQREKKRILEATSRGKVDILIGTHRLLSADVEFRELGLLIVDEEQRFGVAHKEKIRRKRADIDVLTMTATPIPRTLHMALLGIRDISSLATPPPGRLEIATRVVARSARVIREAIVAELRRGGQIFFLHNRVFSIETVKAELTQLVPEARVVVGHGQMSERELLPAMQKFLSGEADVLLSTTIVQSGLDIPRANTILVDGADRFGLAELHQLRGRVGRDITHAHCYLMYDAAKPLGAESRSRLMAMERFSGLGSGFALAMRDLEIRGAGNLLGPEQSGHIAAVGYDMYCKLLQSAVERVTHRAADSGRHPGELEEIVVSEQVDVDLGVDAYLPEDFAGTHKLRLCILRQMDGAVDAASYERVRSSLRDRFGRLPEPVENLCALFLVKHQLGSRGMSAARFLPPDQLVLSHAPGRGPQGAWLGCFADVRPVRADRTHLVLPPSCAKQGGQPELVLDLLRDSLLGRKREATL